jgi:hypothetical protein
MPELYLLAADTGLREISVRRFAKAEGRPRGRGRPSLMLCGSRRAWKD